MYVRRVSPHPGPLPKERQQPKEPFEKQRRSLTEGRALALSLPEGEGGVRGKEGLEYPHGCRILRCARGPGGQVGILTDGEVVA